MNTKTKQFPICVTLILSLLAVFLLPFAAFGAVKVEEPASALIDGSVINYDYSSFSQSNIPWSEIQYSYYYGGHTYIYFRNGSGLSWQQAEDLCESVGGHLATFEGAGGAAESEAVIIRHWANYDFPQSYLDGNYDMPDFMIGFISSGPGRVEDYIYEDIFDGSLHQHKILTRDWQWVTGEYAGYTSMELYDETDYNSSIIGNYLLDSPSWPDDQNFGLLYPYDMEMGRVPQMNLNTMQYGTHYGMYGKTDWVTFREFMLCDPSAGKDFLCEIDGEVQINYFDLNYDGDRNSLTAPGYFTGTPSTFNANNSSGIYTLNSASYTDTPYYIGNKQTVYPVRADYNFNGWQLNEQDYVITGNPRLWNYKETAPYSYTLSRTDGYSPVNYFAAIWNVQTDDVRDADYMALSRFAYYNSSDCIDMTVSQVLNKNYANGTGMRINDVATVSGTDSYNVNSLDWMHATIGNYVVRSVFNGKYGLFAVLLTKTLLDSSQSSFLVYRGTEPTDSWMTDLIADIALVFGNLNKQFPQAVLAYQACQNYSNLTLCGHSLGGGLAEHVAILYPSVNAVTVNSVGGIAIPLTLAKDYYNFHGIDAMDNITALIDTSDIFNDWLGAIYKDSARQNREHQLYTSTTALPLAAHSPEAFIVYNGNSFNTTDNSHQSVNGVWEFSPNVFRNLADPTGLTTGIRYYLGTSGSDNISVKFPRDKLILCGDGNDHVTVKYGQNTVVTGGGENIVSGGQSNDKYIYTGGHLNLNDPGGDDVLLIQGNVTATDVDANNLNDFYLIYTTGGIIEINKYRDTMATMIIKDSNGDVASIYGGILNSYLPVP